MGFYFKDLNPDAQAVMLHLFQMGDVSLKVILSQKPIYFVLLKKDAKFFE